MSIDVEKLAARVVALEQRMTVSADEPKKDDPAEKKASERETLAAEIEALERKLSSADEKKDEKVEEKCAADEKVEDKKDEKKASLVDPNGVEEQITQKRFTEVEKLEHGTELATEPTTMDAAPTEYVARLKSASARLDTVADYLEKTGREELAKRIDVIADAIDQRINAAQRK